MSGGDIAIIVVISLMSIRVLFKGFTSEFSGKSGLCIGFIVSLAFFSSFSEFLNSLFSLGQYALLVSAVSLFLIGYASARALLSVLDDVFNVLNLGFLDHLLGAGFGALEGAALVSVVLYIMQFQTLINLEYFIQDSQFASLLMPYVPSAANAVKQVVYDSEILQEILDGKLQEVVQ